MFFCIANFSRGHRGRAPNTTCAVAAWQVWEGAKEKASIEAFKATLARQLAAEEGRGQGGSLGGGSRIPHPLGGL